MYIQTESVEDLKILPLSLNFVAKFGGIYLY